MGPAFPYSSAWAQAALKSGLVPQTNISKVYAASLPRVLSLEAILLGAVGGNDPWLASPRSWASGDPCLVPADFYKASIRNLVIEADLGL
jgi:hypothetical protein